MEEILVSYRIDKARYHVGTLEGTSIPKLSYFPILIPEYFYTVLFIFNALFITGYKQFFLFYFKSFNFDF